VTAAAKTTLGPSPWPARQRRPVKVYETIDAKAMALTDDEPVTRQKTQGSKYHDLLMGAYQSGKAIKTPPGTASTVSNIARTWLKRQNLQARIQSTGNYGTGDNTGRVWLFKDDQPATTSAAARKRGAA